MESNSDQVSLNINLIAQSLSRSPESHDDMVSKYSADCCIYIVPPHLRELCKEMYTPRVVSIGPFHHGMKELEAMEEHKRRYLHSFLDRIKMTMEKYIEDLEGLERRLHESYVEINGSYSREKFIEIMAVDGAFLMEYLLRYYIEEWESNDRIFGRKHLRTNVRYDLLLIENQLPFFYLEHLFELFKKYFYDNDDDNDKLSLKMIVQYYLSDASTWGRSVHAEIVAEQRKVEHLLHFLIICCQDEEEEKEERQQRLEGREWKRMECNTWTISELHQAGVKFKPSSSKCLSNIKFSNGTLKIPILKLTEKVEMVFRNMQAFEQCHDSRNYISDYICIMDMLINNEEDVKLLVKNGIIHNCLEDNRAAATVFNNLGKGNYINRRGNLCYSQFIGDLNTYCQKKRHKWRATLKQKYFHNPWSIISVIAAAFLLLLTIIQTVCSILGLV